MTTLDRDPLRIVSGDFVAADGTRRTDASLRALAASESGESNR